MKPRVFIGSSTEGLDVARYVARKLTDMECVLWTDQLFHFNGTAFHSLIYQAGLFDFGILVATKDDFTTSREKLFETARDNVIFEFGLFLGRLDADRTFLLQEEGVKLPSDLLGVTLPHFEKTKLLYRSKSLERSISELNRQILRQAVSGKLGLLSSTALAINYYHNFIRLVIQSFASKKKLVLKGRTIRKFQLNVVVPLSLDVDIKEQAHIYYSDKALRKIDLPTPGRPYPVHVVIAPGNEEVLQIFDMPTTLLGINKAIELYTADRQVGKKDERRLLEIRELRNFIHVLQLLVQEDSYARSVVRIITDPPSDEN